MADVLSEKSRHYNMTQIRSTDTKPEEMVRKYLFSRGLRYLKNDNRYLGKPDLVLPKYRTMVFVNGCFWHMHTTCRYFKMPKSNSEYWVPKLAKNHQRDFDNKKLLEEQGWRVIIVWECLLKPKVRQSTLENLYKEIVYPVSFE